jgi:hypothetical protein
MYARLRHLEIGGFEKQGRCGHGKWAQTPFTGEDFPGIRLQHQKVSIVETEIAQVSHACAHEECSLGEKPLDDMGERRAAAVCPRDGWGAAGLKLSKARAK